MIADFFAILTSVWPLPQHTFISNYANRKEVYLNTMILPAHYLGCHVAGRPRCVFRVICFWAPRSCNAKISDAEVTIRIKDNILRF